MPSWSPDGRRFVCSRYGEQQGVWLMEADGQKGELLDAAGWGIQWSPDGASVAYSRGRNVVVRQLATGEERLLFPAMIAPYSTIFWNMTWSPDSRKIAMIAATEGGVREVAIVDAQGAEFGFARRASGHFNPMLSWNADGQRLVFPERTPTRMELRELNPKTNDASIPVPGIPPEAKIASACWIPDGSRLIVLCNSR
jgi:TolB protein